jgi:predicted nucleic acid-binding protein
LKTPDDDELYLSVISIGEFCKGFTVHPEEHRRASLREWLDSTQRPWFAGRILPVSEAISERWGILEGECQLKGLTINAPDGMMAATTLEHDLGRVQPVHVAAYIELLQGKRPAPTVKQHLACIRMLFDWLVTGQVMPSNPAHSVRGPRHSVNKGSTPVLSSEEATALLTGMDVSKTKIRVRNTHTNGYRAVNDTGQSLPAVMQSLPFSRIKLTASKARFLQKA